MVKSARKWWRAITVATAIMLVAGAAAAAGAKFEQMDIFELEYASDPRISPDGKQIVYVRNFMDIMTDERRSNLWIVNSDGSGHRPLTSGNDSHTSPRWSPRGGRLLYVSTADGSPQLHVRWMDTGQAAKVTNFTRGPGNIVWSPDGTLIAFTMDVPDKPKPLATMPEMPEGAEWAKPVKVIDRLIYRADGAGYLEQVFTHLFVVPADGGTPRQLTSGNFDYGGEPAWTRDGQALLISTNRNDNWEYEPRESEIFEVPVGGGEITALTDRKGPDFGPVVSPDGKLIAYLGLDDREQGYQVTHLYVMNRDGGGKRLIAGDFDRDIKNPRWRRDGRGLFFRYDEEGNSKIGFVTLAGAVSTLASDLGGTSLGRPYASGSYSVSNNGTFAFTLTRPDRPADVATGRARARVRRLTNLNDDLLGHKELAGVEEIRFESSYDGRPIQGWIAKPPGFDPVKKYPLILEIHGGPFADYGDRFSAEIQLYAAAGYVVLYTNPRGSTSYGEEFGNLIHHNYPGEDYDDLMSAVDAVIAKGFVDEDNLFVTGGSGGGVLSSWIVGKTGRFSAAVVAKPVINWTSFALTSDFYNFFYRYWFPGFPWDHQEQYWKRSPLSLVGNVTTPTMLLTGEADHRTPISETEQFYQALKLRKIDTAMVRVPDAPHGIAGRPSNLIAKVANILAWFEKYRTEEN